MDKKYFEIKEEHLKLLSKMNVEWNNCEFGSPTIDPKRPYGNSDVVLDIHKILGGEPLNEDEIEENGQSYDDIYEGLQSKYEILHKETMTALQITLVTQSFEVGLYEADGYRYKWKKVK